MDGSHSPPVDIFTVLYPINRANFVYGRIRGRFILITRPTAYNNASVTLPNFCNTFVSNRNVYCIYVSVRVSVGDPCWKIVIFSPHSTATLHYLGLKIASKIKEIRRLRSKTRSRYYPRDIICGEGVGNRIIVAEATPSLTEHTPGNVVPRMYRRIHTVRLSELASSNAC